LTGPAAGDYALRMIHKRRLHPLVMAGLVFLVLGSLSLRIHASSMGGEDLHDAISGLLYGLAIGCMLFGIWKSRRRPEDGDSPPEPSS
jgi:peptidoglycan/LPS O-acetylase OafA/YrhL